MCPHCSCQEWAFKVTLKEKHPRASSSWGTGAPPSLALAPGRKLEKKGWRFYLNLPTCRTWANPKFTSQPSRGAPGLQGRGEIVPSDTKSPRLSQGELGNFCSSSASCEHRRVCSRPSSWDRRGFSGTQTCTGGVFWSTDLSRISP